jgi:MAternally-affected-uncoordination protein
LKLAHAKTKDTQLVAACLRALGSIASERSASNEQQQALDMLQSAFTLSKAQDDLDGQVEALRRLVESHEKKGSSEKEKKTLSDYLQKKEKQMEDDLGKLSKEENKNNVVMLEKGLKDLMK